ncbi:MAG: MFS transporter [Candidatus Marsarchaeota archaeon]|nr:MFS transporter [Candidatus Marsarchaeota archaeon]
MGISARLKGLKDGKSFWMYSMLPYQIAYGPISTIIALFILDLGGTVIDVSYAMATFYGISIPASMMWGMLVDRYGSRKPFVYISVASAGLVLLALSFINSIALAILLFGVLSLFTAALATPLSLLVMETIEKRFWASGFSKLQMLSSIGGSFGLLIASVLTGFLPLRVVMLLLIPFVIIGILIAMSIQEPAKNLERRAIIKNSAALRFRLLMHNLIFIRVPGMRFMKSVFMPKRKKLNQLSVIYIGMFAFYLGSAIFNTAYVPGLRNIGFANVYVFAIIFVGYAVQSYVFNYSGRFTESKGERNALRSSLLMRAIGYVAIGAAFFVLVGVGSLVVNIILYALTAGLAYSIFYTASNTLLFENVGSEKPGRKLGLYSSIVGLSYLIGSLVAGYMAYYVSYGFSFVVSGLLIFVSLFIFLRIYRQA